MANFFLRSRPTITWVTVTPYALGTRRLSTGTVPARGIHFEVTTAGTSAVVEPIWNTTIGGTTTDGTVIWTTRGSANTWVALTVYVAGDRVVGTSAAAAADRVLVFECTTGGTTGGSEPAWTNTVAGTTADGTVTWTTREATTWGNAHIFIAGLNAAATSAPAAGDTLYVGDEHNETTAAGVSITIRGSATAPIRVLCVVDTNDPALPTTLATTAVIATTGANTITVVSPSIGIFDGFTFRCGDAASLANFAITNGAAASSVIFKNCAIVLNNTGTASAITIGGLGTSQNVSNVTWLNTTVTFGAVTQTITTRAANFIWTDTSGAAIVGGVGPTALITPAALTTGRSLLEGLDLSAIVATKSVLNQTAGAPVFLMRNCTLGVGGSNTVNPHPGATGDGYEFINVGPVETNPMRYGRSTPGGSENSEVTVIRTDGATNGSIPFSWRVSTTVSATYDFPFISFPIRIWNTTIGSPRIITVEILRDSLTALTDAEIWVATEFLGIVNTPKSSFVTDAATTTLTAGINQEASTATWVTTGLTNPNRQKLQVIITPQVVGLITARVHIAIPSTTIFVDPFITVI